MKKKHKRYNAKTKGRMFIFMMIFIVTIFTLCFTLIRDLKRINDMNLELNRLKKQVVVLHDEEESIEADIKKLSDPSYVARYAREKYFYSKDGELILRMKEKKENE